MTIHSAIPIQEHLAVVLARPEVPLYGGGCPRDLALKHLGYGSYRVGGRDRTKSRGSRLSEMLRPWRWGCKLRPGDLVNGCTTWPYNTIVERVEIRRANIREYEWGNCDGWVVHEVTAYTTDGRQHSFPGGGCLSEPLTPDEIRDVLTFRTPDGPMTREGVEKMVAEWGVSPEREAEIMRQYEWALDPSHPVCDERGMKLEVPYPWNPVSP